MLRTQISILHWVHRIQSQPEIFWRITRQPGLEEIIDCIQIEKDRWSHTNTLLVYSSLTPVVRNNYFESNISLNLFTSRCSTSFRRFSSFCNFNLFSSSYSLQLLPSCIALQVRQFQCLQPYESNIRSMINTQEWLQYTTQAHIICLFWF